MVMVVIAMLVMVMAVIMLMMTVITVGIMFLMAVIVVAVVMRRMIVRRMVVTAMAVRVIVRMRVRSGIGAAFGIERRLDLDDAGAESRHHRLNDVVAANPQALRHDLRRQMAIAEMPGDPHQMQRIGAADFDQRLGSGDHLDQAAVLQHQGITTAQRDGVFQIKQELEPARA